MCQVFIRELKPKSNRNWTDTPNFQSGLGRVWYLFIRKIAFPCGWSEREHKNTRRNCMPSHVEETTTPTSVYFSISTGQFRRPTWTAGLFRGDLKIKTIGNAGSCFLPGMSERAPSANRWSKTQKSGAHFPPATYPIFSLARQAETAGSRLDEGVAVRHV